MKRQVQASVVVAAVAVVVVGGVLVRTSVVAGGVVVVLGLLVLGAYGGWSLRRGRHTRWAVAQEHVRRGHAVVLWKPGCPYCERLLRAFGDDERVTWVNVWHDQEAQQRVCDLNDGNEYVPTVLVGAQVLRNPSATELRSALS